MDLATLLAEARRKNPGISVPDDVFATHLARFVTPGRPVEELRISELYLACACAEGNPAAVARVEAEHFGLARAAVKRLDPSVADDVLQKVREALFVVSPPRIAAYAGRGDLAKWIRTVAMRTAMDHLAPRREVPVSDERMASFELPTVDDPQTELMKRQYGPRFKEALTAAVAKLSAEARADLRAYYIEGRQLSEIAGARGVAISTVSRRVAHAREALLRETRGALLERLGVAEAELDSILRVLDTRLELSRSAFDEKP